MPHVIQLSKAPVPQEDRLNEAYYEFDDELLHYVADYVVPDEAPQETIANFLRELKELNLTIEENNEYGGEYGFALQPGFQEAYFKSSYISFLEYARKLAATTLDDFIKGMPDAYVFHLREAFDERFGWYVYFDTMTISLDKFMRHWAEAGVRYYIGGIVYYHT